MRVVSGTLGSRKIKTLKSDISRPTSAKIRAAIFDHLGSRFSWGTMLDVFAGTGAMSYEALSRGFDKAVLIEKDYRAMKIIRDNVNNLKLHNQVELIQDDSEQRLGKLQASFDLIFIDPPYKYDAFNELLNKVVSLELLNDKGYCIIETDHRQQLADEYESLVRYQKKKYGNTTIHYYRKA